MFTKRTEGNGIMFSGNHTPGQLLKSTVGNGDMVVLRIGDESVLVKDIECLPNQKFRGIVYGFEPSYSLEIQGLKIDDEVEFDEEHIVSCSS